MQCFYIAVFCFLAFTIHAGAGLRCWSCSSNNERHCGDPFNKTYMQLRDCNTDITVSHQRYTPQEKIACKKYKHTTTATGQELVVRQCVYDKDTACNPSTTYTSVTDTFCEVCTEDGCNGANKHMTSVIMTILPAVLWTLAAKIL